MCFKQHCFDTGYFGSFKDVNVYNEDPLNDVEVRTETALMELFNVINVLA